MSKILTKKEEHRYVTESVLDFKKKSLFLKKTALWAGTSLGKKGEDLSDYKKEFIDLISEKGDTEELVLNKLFLDFNGVLTKEEIKEEINNINDIIKRDLLT